MAEVVQVNAMKALKRLFPRTNRVGFLPFAHGPDGEAYWLMGVQRYRQRGLEVLSDFGGGCEFRESPMECGLREVAEESSGLLVEPIQQGLRNLRSRKLAWLIRRSPGRRKRRLLVMVPIPFDPRLPEFFQPNDEVTGLRWIPVAEALGLPLKNFHQPLWPYLTTWRREGLKLEPVPEPVPVTSQDLLDLYRVGDYTRLIQMAPRLDERVKGPLEFTLRMETAQDPLRHPRQLELYATLVDAPLNIRPTFNRILQDLLAAENLYVDPMVVQSILQNSQTIESIELRQLLLENLIDQETGLPIQDLDMVRYLELTDRDEIFLLVELIEQAQAFPQIYLA